MNEFTSRQYDTDEVSRFIRRALKLKRVHGISYQDLIDTAREIGLDVRALETAIDQERQAKKKKRSEKYGLKTVRWGSARICGVT